MNEAAHTVSLISPSKSPSSFKTSNSDPTSMSAKLILRVEWNKTLRTYRDPFDTKKFSNLSPKILVECMGVARIFQRGGHTDSYIGYSPNCHLNIVGCLLTKRLTKGGSRAPQDPPWLRPWLNGPYPSRPHVPESTLHLVHIVPNESKRF